MPSLRTSIIRFESVGSTNTEATILAARGAPEGLCVVAEEQTAGRGRLDREWISPKGAGLYFSIVLRPTLEQRFLPLITLMASLAVRDALVNAFTMEPDIKWPNDILVDGRKVSGILAEVIETPSGRAVVVGIGINLSSSGLPSELKEIATSIESVCARPADRELLLSSLITALADRYAQLQSSEGGASTLAEWTKVSSFARDKHVRVRNGEFYLEGITRGVEDDGALRVETDDGEIRTVRAGDLTVVRQSDV
jgi:BirA family biotin operon repressor/biotin-[acetyl-CoA-carboxylase] ligase